jgi:hypothetical protein
MNTKYKFEETVGCTAFNFTVNDRAFSELNTAEYNEMLDHLFLKIREGLSEQTILLEDLVRLFEYDNYAHDPHVCDQCGDSVSTATWFI